METSLKGKVALVTGATNGIGLVTARELAQLGARVTIVSRELEKCARVAEEIGAEFITADLSAQAGVMQAAATFKQRHSHLHILVNNAGAYFARRQVSADGFEMTFALNHLNYFLLTNLLLDVLKASAPARIVNVSSGAHFGANLDLDDLQNEKRYRGFEVYARSKTANVLFTYELARRLKGTGVTANALHPGYVDTGFALNNGVLFRIFARLSARLFARRPEEGARTSLYLATSPEVEGVSGKYFTDCKPMPSSPQTYDQDLAGKLWQTSLELTASAA